MAAQTGNAPAIMSHGDWAALLFLSVLWGASFFFYKILDTALPAMTISLGRVGIGAAALNIVLRARGLRLTRALPWGRLAVVGVLSSALPFILFAAAEKHISSSLAALLNAMTPINAVLIAPLFRDGGGWGRWRLFGAASGLVGVAILLGLDALSGLGTGAGRDGLLGQVEVLAATMCYAVGSHLGRGLRSVPPLLVATAQMTAGALVIAPLALALDRPWTLPMPGAPVWAALLAIALLGSALAYIIFFSLIARVGATNTMLVTFLSPVSALLLGWLLLGEHLPGRTWIGVAFIALGLLCVEGLLPRALARLRTRGAG